MWRFQLLFFILFSSSTFALFSSGRHGDGMKACTSAVCSNQRGYFYLRHFLITSTTPYWASKELQWNIPTTFHLLIKSPQTGRASLRVCRDMECQMIIPISDYVMVYTNVTKLALYTDDPNQSDFYVEYYIGCQHLIGDNLQIRSDSSVIPPGSCWIVAPYDNNQSLDVARVLGSFDDINLFGSSSLTVKDLIKGESIKKIGSDVSSELFDVIPYDVTESIQLRIRSPRKFDVYKLSTLILVDIDICSVDRRCRDFSFDLATEEMSSHELSCLNRERYCNYGLGETELPCKTDELPGDDDDAVLTCPSLHNMLFNYLEADEIIDPDADTSTKKIKRKRRIQMNIKRCAKKMKRRERHVFCTKRGRNNCKNFGLCSRYCRFYTRTLRVCDSNGYTGFRLLFH